MDKVFTVKRGRIVDAEGAPARLHGVNVVNKDPRAGYLYFLSQEDWDALARIGVNCVRLGIFWDGLEPSPRRFASRYLDQVERQVDAFANHGIAVILDMHQDLYARRYADGAPDWAVLNDGMPHRALPGMWSSAYLISPAVQHAIDSFWSNAMLPDGWRLQEHFQEAWRRVAARFGDHPYVVGYDLYNEPIPGSGAGATAARLQDAVQDCLSREAGRPVKKAELWDLYTQPSHLEKWLRELPLKTYIDVIDTVAPYGEVFDRTVLQPFYNRVAAAIRVEDSSTMLFFCNSYFGNLGVPSALEALGGRYPDPCQVYAPHGYDLVVDTDIQAYSQERVNFIFYRHAKAARRMGVPMVVGEWGAFYGDTAARDRVRATLLTLEALEAGDMYWCYVPGETRQTPCFSQLAL